MYHPPFPRLSLIYTCELCGANPFDYLTELQRHAVQLASNPENWMPWNYRQTLESTATVSVTARRVAASPPTIAMGIPFSRESRCKSSSTFW